MAIGATGIGAAGAAVVGGRLAGEHDGGRASSTRAEAAALDVLAAWDAQRAGCWARGDRACLRGLYVEGSPAGLADDAALAAWRARGLRVEGMGSQVLALDVWHRSPERLLLDVTDRTVGAMAVDAAGRARALPADQPSRRTVDLRRTDGRWRVLAVREARP